MGSTWSIIIVGPTGHGKSTTGNKLLKENAFTHGESNSSITNYVHIKEKNGFKIADCIGFGDTKDEKIFCNSYNEKQSEIEKMAPINAILFVIKYFNTESTAFKNSSQEYYTYFGKEALKSTLLVCIQAGNIKHSDEKFESILKSSDGYRYLKEKHGKDIPYVLWDNINEYPNQQATLENKIRKLERRFDARSIAYLFDVFNRFFSDEFKKLSNQQKVLPEAENFKKIKEQSKEPGYFTNLLKSLYDTFPNKKSI